MTIIVQSVIVLQAMNWTGTREMRIPQNGDNL